MAEYVRVCVCVSLQWRLFAIVVFTHCHGTKRGFEWEKGRIHKGEEREKWKWIRGIHDKRKDTDRHTHTHGVKESCLSDTEATRMDLKSKKGQLVCLREAFLGAP